MTIRLIVKKHQWMNVLGVKLEREMGILHNLKVFPPKYVLQKRRKQLYREIW